MEFIIEETPMEKICINPNQCLNNTNEVNAICGSDYCFDCGCLGDCGSFGLYRQSFYLSDLNKLHIIMKYYEKLLSIHTKNFIQQKKEERLNYKALLNLMRSNFCIYLYTVYQIIIVVKFAGRKIFYTSKRTYDNGVVIYIINIIMLQEYEF